MQPHRPRQEPRPRARAPARPGPARPADLLLVGREVAVAEGGVGRLEVLRGLGEQLARPSGSTCPVAVHRPAASPRRARPATAPSSASSSVPPVPTASPFDHHDELQLGHGRRLVRTDVRGLDVEERVLDRDHQQVAEQHGGTALAQQRAFGGELRILVQPREDDAGAGHVRLRRELERQQIDRRSRDRSPRRATPPCSADPSARTGPRAGSSPSVSPGAFMSR